MKSLDIKIIAPTNLSKYGDDYFIYDPNGKANEIIIGSQIILMDNTAITEEKLKKINVNDFISQFNIQKLVLFINKISEKFNPAINQNFTEANKFIDFVKSKMTVEPLQKIKLPNGLYSPKLVLNFNYKMSNVKNGIYKTSVQIDFDNKDYYSNIVDFSIYKSSPTPGNINIIEAADNEKTIFQTPLIKPYLYQGGKNKVLFKIDKFFPISNDDPYGINFLNQNKIQNEKTIYLTYKKEYYTGTTAKIYFTKNEPKNLSEIANDSNLLKTLNISKDQLSFNYNLDPDQEYYFIAKGEHLSTSKKINLIDYSPIQKIKVIKDAEIYLLENEVFADIINGEISLKQFVDKEKIKVFLGKTHIEPKFNFSLGYDLNNEIFFDKNPTFFSLKSNAKFDSSYEAEMGVPVFNYFKLRLTSKKTNRKIDINLNYSLLQKAQNIKNLKEIQNKNKKKLNLVLYYTINSKLGGQVALEKFNLFINELRKQIFKFNPIVTELPVNYSDDGFATFSFQGWSGKENVVLFLQSFLKYLQEDKNDLVKNNGPLFISFLVNSKFKLL